MKKLVLAAAAAALLPVPAFAQDREYNEDDYEPTARDGLRIEGRVHYERINDPDEANAIDYELGSGIGFGGEIGYDVAVSDSIAVGPFVTYDVSTIEECDLDLCVSSGGYFVAGLHAGFALGPNSQLYAKGGYSSLTIDVEGSLDDGFGNTVFVDDSETGGGFHFAFGYEQGFGRNAYGRVELGVGENSDIYGFDFQRTNIGVAFGTRF